MAVLLQIFGKRFLTQISPLHSLSLTLRSVHESVYNKNPEEQVRGTVVPDNGIPSQPESYWSPHPRTGVFGPSKAHKPSDRGLHTTNSVLEQKAFFRPLEDLDKPFHA